MTTRTITPGIEFKYPVDVLRLLDLSEEREVLNHELGGRLLAVEVEQVDDAFALQLATQLFRHKLLVAL